MTILGRSLWDDPRYASGTIQPNAIGYDLGSAQLPWHNLYLDGDVIFSSGSPGILDSVATVAATGTNLATAAPTTAVINYVTAADGTKAVKLEDVPIGSTVIVTNVTPSSVSALTFLPVYPEAAGSAFQGAANGAAVRLGAGQTATFTRQTATKWGAEINNSWYTDITTGDLISNQTTTSQILGRSIDGADNVDLYISPAGAASAGRGAYLGLGGNEAATTGIAALVAGNAAGSHIFLQCSGSAARIRMYTLSLERWRLDEGGDLTSLATNGGNLIFAIATKGIQLQSGANGRTGTFTANGATPVVVSNTSLAAGDQIIITRDTIGGTPGAWNLTARTNGASFGFTGTASDTSVFRYTLVRIN